MEKNLTLREHVARYALIGGIATAAVGGAAAEIVGTGIQITHSTEAAQAAAGQAMMPVFDICGGAIAVGLTTAAASRKIS